MEQNLALHGMNKKRSYKASEPNDVNGDGAAMPETASGRRLEVSSVVTMRNPHCPSITQHNNSKSFEIHEVVGDGNCLFRAVSLYLFGTEDEHMTVRHDAVSYVRRNWKDLHEHLVITDPNLKDQRSYCYYMRQEKTYGTSVEILALSEVHELNFNLYTERVRPLDKRYSTDMMPTIINKNRQKNNINLLLTGDLEEGHFDLLNPFEDQRSERNKSWDNVQGMAIHEDVGVCKSLPGKTKESEINTEVEERTEIENILCINQFHEEIQKKKKRKREETNGLRRNTRRL